MEMVVLAWCKLYLCQREQFLKITYDISDLTIPMSDVPQRVVFFLSVLEKL